jgi:hypothetical protein
VTGPDSPVPYWPVMFAAEAETAHRALPCNYTLTPEGEAALGAEPEPEAEPEPG